jgi:hypothetical protein
MPVSAGMHESGPLRQGGRGRHALSRYFPRTAMGASQSGGSLARSLAVAAYSTARLILCLIFNNE